MKLSVITVCLNPGTALQHCIDSVQEQKGVCLEHVVIDGGSTDGTLERLRSVGDSRFRWISESDGGIAEAMNKGISRAAGEWLLFLQADDRLHRPGVLEHALEEIREKSELIIFPVEIEVPGKMPRIWNPQPNRLWRKMPGSHQGMLFRRQLFERFGPYDTSYRIAMDYAYLHRLKRHCVRFETGATLLSTVSGQGISSQRSWKPLRRRLSEEQRVHMEFAKGKSHRLAYRLYWTWYLIYRRFPAARAS
jgi:glycosyltransferase involved in cell wall biosynthesis